MTSPDAFPFTYLENSKFLVTLQYLIQVLCLLLAFPATPFTFCWAKLFSSICAGVINDVLVSPARL